MASYHGKTHTTIASPNCSAILRKSAFYEKDFSCDSRKLQCIIANINRKFESHFRLVDDTRPIRPHKVLSEKNVDAVAESVPKDSDESISRRSQQIGLYYLTTWCR